MNQNKLKKEIYQNGKERSLEKLNYDRHLAAKNFLDLVEQTIQDLEMAEQWSKSSPKDTEVR